MPLSQADHEVQVSADGQTVWVHVSDGSTVGRYSARFGMDVHNTVAAQLAGAPQCLSCTHEEPKDEDWQAFCRLMQDHYGICVPQDINPHQRAHVAELDNVEGDCVNAPVC